MNAPTLQSTEVPVARSRIDDNPRLTIQRVLCNAGVPDDVAAGYAALICREFTGEAIYFAIHEWQDTAERDERVRAERRAGRSLTWLAQQFCLSRTHVRRVCGELGSR